MIVTVVIDMNIKELKRILCEYLEYYIKERELVIKSPCRCRIIRVYNFLQCTIITNPIAETYEKKIWFKGIPLYEIAITGQEGARITARIDLDEIAIVLR